MVFLKQHQTTNPLIISKLKGNKIEQTFPSPSKAACLTCIRGFCYNMDLCVMLQVFQANNDATEVVLNKLHSPLLTRFVRVRPQTWHSGIALRLELFGCRVTGEVGLL